jgi:menaquinone-dependent protoporphyrinogen oxidase
VAGILILYASTDGHAGKIGKRMQQIIEQQEHQVTLICVNAEIQGDLQAFDKIVMGASIRYGKHSPQILDFIRRNQHLLDVRPNAFFQSISYPKYGYFDRLIMRLIMLITEGPTDPEAGVEFTDWQQVASFGGLISASRFESFCAELWKLSINPMSGQLQSVK